MALQFPDFDPVAIPIPAFHVDWMAQAPIAIVSGAAGLAAVGALVWRARRAARDERAAGEAPPAKAARIADVVLWNAVRTVAATGVVGVLLFALVRVFHLDLVGPFPVRWYALAYIAGILLGWRYGVGLVRNARLWGPKTPTATPPQIDDLILWITLGIILGGRIGYICFYMLVDDHQRAALFADPLSAFEIWNGGMSFHGGFLGAGLAIVLFARANGIGLLLLGDLAAPCEPIGHFFVRIANFVNGELWGRPTHVPWGMVFCNAHIAAASNGVCPAGPDPRHPSQLYEAALEGVVMFLVLRWATHRAKWLQKRGAILGLWLAGYGLSRTLLETVRNPDEGMPSFPLGLTMGMMLSIPMIVIGVWLLWRALREPAPQPLAS